jgi:Ca2+-binding RTX toxin-like protein
MDGNDILRGSYGNDFLFGGEGDDILLGGAGADFLSGDNGNDTLNGAGGFNPTLGADGNDQLTGGNGNDIYIFDLSSTPALNGIPLGTDTVTESVGGGFADVLLGIGPSGIAVNLSSGGAQPYNDLNGNLILTLILTNPGQVEFSF